MLSSELEFHLYPGAVWTRNDGVTVVLVETSLTAVKFMQMGSTASESSEVMAFLKNYLPVNAKPKSEDIDPATTKQMMDVLENMSDKVPNKDLYKFSLAVVKLLNEYNPNWCKDPSVTVDLLRIATEAAVTVEMHLTNDTGNILDILVMNLTQMYKASCDSAKELLKTLDSDLLSQDKKAPDRQ